MPAPGSNRAPKTFDGSEDDIADCLELFENCANDAQLPDKEKVSFIFRYLSHGQKDVFKTFEGYEELDWTKFKVAIEEAFEGAFKEKKYTRQSLIQFTRNTATLPIQTDAELRAYQRGFQAITHYLIKEQIITEDEHDRYYWFGFHQDTRKILERRLTTMIPDHPRSKAYRSADVFRASKYLFEQIATILFTQSTTLHTASIRELDAKIQGKHAEIGIYDPGAELVCISDVAAKELGLPFSTDMQLSMTDANGGSKATFGIIENLELVIGGMSIYVHAWIIKDAPYRLLLGRPFQLAARADTEDIGD
ncbi:hypothetical protein M422DRAFT_98930, partial [Sphaerobolus stellatus SS14]